MVYRAYFAAVFGELESALNADDAARAAQCFAFPTLIRSQRGIEVFDTEAALSKFFANQIATQRRQGVARIAFDLGDVFASGPVGLAEIVWHHVNEGGTPGARSRVWYHMVDTASGWRIESVRSQD